MIDLPIGKAIIAVVNDVQCKVKCRNENYKCPNQKNCCEGCVMKSDILRSYPDEDLCEYFSCVYKFRKDGKKVHFQLVDYPTNGAMGN